MNAGTNSAALLGRVLISVIFFVSGYSKIVGFAATAAGMAEKGLPMTSVLLVLTIVLELAGALALVLGWKTRWAALGLLLFSVLATVLYHDFWAVAADKVSAQQTQFLKNLAMMGGLLLLMAFGPGRYAVDRSR